MAVWWFIAAAMVAGLVSYLTFKVKRNPTEKMIEKFGGPPGLPLLGNIDIIRISSVELMRTLMEWREKYGSLFRISLLHESIMTVCDPENIKIVWTKCLDGGKSRETVRRSLGQSLAVMDGSEWQQKRRVLNAAFNMNLMHDTFLNVFNECNDKLMLQLADQCGLEIDLWSYVYSCFNEIICMTTLGYHDDDGGATAYRERILQFGNKMERYMHLITLRIRTPWLYPNLFFRIRNRLFGDHKLLEDLLYLPLQILQKKREEMKNSNLKDISVEADSKKVASFIDIIFRSDVYKSVTDEELASEILMLIIAGSETAALPACYTLLMLAKHVNAQKRVHEELDNVFGNSTRRPNFDDLNKLNFMTCCINESLRLFPPVPLTARATHTDIELADGRVIPTGTSIWAPIIVLHRDSRIYENANQWNPDRFQPEELEKLHPASFIPFSFGSRMCPGNKYAMLAIKAQVSTILRQYRLTTNLKDLSELVLDMSMTLRNSSGFKVTIETRTT